MVSMPKGRADSLQRTMPPVLRILFRVAVSAVAAVSDGGVGMVLHRAEEAAEPVGAVPAGASATVTGEAIEGCGEEWFLCLGL